MGRAKPTLGYPSRTAAVMALSAEGMNTRQIARRIGIDVTTVAALRSSGERPRRDRPSEQIGRTVVIPVDVLDALRPLAARRGMSTNALVRQIVETVADDGLVDAVLDDDGAAE